MLRRLLSPPRLPAGRSIFSLHRLLSRPRLATVLLLALLAALLEVLVHTGEFAVSRPGGELDEPFHIGCREPAAAARRESAALVMLVRNSELAGALKTVQSVERHFNRWFHYPVVFLNDEPWEPQFVEAMDAAVSGEAVFEVIPRDEWTFPSWMDGDAARESIRRQGERGILYAGRETYHHMCRFYSGKFYTLEALKEYKWYWRIEPDVDFHCSITYDPFVEMAKHDKIYGFTIALWEVPSTCPGLFREVADWKERHRIKTTELWKATMTPSWLPWPFRSMMSWARHRDRYGDGWSLCHYWSNFEIGNLDFFRGRGYQDLFEHLDKTGGFYFERWGDAAVHALALAMLVEPERIHHFEDFGYRHDWYFQCPANAPGRQLPESEALGDFPFAPEQEGGIGCRCECDGRKTRNHASYCLNTLKSPNTARRPSFLGWCRSWFD